MNDLAPTPAPSVVTATRDPHYLVDRLLKLEQDSASKQFLGGLKTTFSSVKFMVQNRSLWSHIAIPAAINLLVFIATAAALLLNHDWFLLPEPAEGAWTYYVLIVLWWLYSILLYPLLLIVAYFLTLILAGIVASPFNETLSERAEEIMMGTAPQSPTGWKENIMGGLRGIMTAAATGIPRAIVVLFLGLIPGIGPILAAVVGAYFIAVGYTDYAFERRRYSLKQKLHTIWKHRQMAIGFGVGANVMLLVPLLNFLCMPIAVVGGTALAVALDDFESREPAQSDSE